MNEFLRKLRWLMGRSGKEAELREELEFHLEAEAGERESAGVSHEQARQAALRELGNVTLVREDTRATWGWTSLEQLGQDLRYALRTMASNRTFTAMAVLSLALGIGANTAIYSFVESILLRSLPVPDPQSLVVMKWRAPVFPRVGFSASSGAIYNDPKGGTVASVFPYPALPLLQSNTAVLGSAFGYFGGGSLNITIGQETEAIEGQYVSGDYFRGLGVPPAAGRLILSGDDRAGAAAVAVLNYRYSRQRFGEAANAVGQSIRINNTPFTVVGVAPPQFFGADPASVPDVWLPMHANLLLDPLALKTVAAKYLDRNFYWIEIMGRLKPGISPARAQAVLGPQFRQFAESSASSDRERANLPTLAILEGAAGLDSLRHKYSRPLAVLAAMAGLILLIACANISNLLLARAIARRREIAVRLSMGAGRMRVVRQLLTESVLLAAMGGALGVAFAFWGIRFLTLLLASGRTNFTLHAQLNWHVLGVTFALSVLTGLLFGVAPAIQATRADVMPALKELLAGTPSRASRHALPRVSVSQFLVGGQIALSLMLLVSAGLFGQTLSNLQSIELGFNRENVMLFTLNPRAAGYEGPALNRLYTDIRERLTQIPGVRSVSMSGRPLLSGSGTTTSAVEVPGVAPPGAGKPNVGLFDVGPAFFQTMQIPVFAGREFDERDGGDPSPVAVVNQRFVKAFGLENPIGRTVNLKPRSYQIVGVVGDALFLNLKEERHPMLYLPFSRPPGQATFEVRAAGNPLDHAKTVREIVRQIDSRLAVSGLETQAARINQAISQEIALARLCTVFAALALTIACVGLYGTMAFHVTRRTGEIGIRMALGAERSSIVWLVLREIFSVGVAGLAAGVVGALSGSRYVASFLYGIKPHDPLALTAAVLILLSAALIAGYVPARRASRIDPMRALRHE